MSKTALLRGGAAASRQAGKASRSFGAQPEPDSSIYPAEFFLRLLCLERKRAERSERPFLLVLADVQQLISKPEGEALVSSLGRALVACARETDITGWYQEGRVFGLIFTEINKAKKYSIAAMLLSRVTSILLEHLTREECQQIRVSVHVFPEDRGEPSQGEPLNSALYPDLFPGEDSKKFSHFIKRVMDIAGGFAGIVLFAPLYLAIALFISLTSPGPILFKQERVGQYNRVFTLLKFRTMEVGHDASIHREFVKQLIENNGDPQSCQPGDEAVYKITQDPRVTRIGRWLRKTSLDELPQFLNVLRGDMSLVGPRPPIPYELESYRVWHRRRLLETKPGITGLWQVNGRSRTRFDDMVRLDLEYARKWSLWLDIKILLQTPRAVCSGEGAY